MLSAGQRGITLDELELGGLNSKYVQALNMIPDILRKLKDVIDAGITTEVHTVYLMAQIRKLIERENDNAFPYLKFYCNWALHTKLTNKTAQGILQEFEKEHLRLKVGLSFDDLPDGMRAQIEKISKMHLFREELNGYLSYHGLPTIGGDGDGWSKFMYCYSHVIKDCPLEIKLSDESSTINLSLWMLKTRSEMRKASTSTEYHG